MKNLSESLIIYRLKFKSKNSFDNAIQTLRFGQRMARYLESLQTSLRLEQSEPNYPTIKPPEINICQDDLVIYICSHEYTQGRQGSPITDITTERMAETMPLFPYYHYYEPFLRGIFGTNAELTVTTEKHA
jgi:hypothetical protein